MPSLNVLSRWGSFYCIETPLLFVRDVHTYVMYIHQTRPDKVKLYFMIFQFFVIFSWIYHLLNFLASKNMRIVFIVEMRGLAGRANIYVAQWSIDSALIPFHVQFQRVHWWEIVLCMFMNYTNIDWTWTLSRMPTVCVWLHYISSCSNWVISPWRWIYPVSGYTLHR